MGATTNWGVSTQAPTVAGVGIYKDVTQFEAPAGAALIYDSR